MATNFLWGPVGTVQHLLTTEMNSLAAATLTALGPEVNNSSGYQFGNLYLHVASAAFVAGNYLAVYFLPSDDTAGSIYTTLGTAAQMASSLNNYWVGNIGITGTTAAHDEVLPGVQIPLGKFKCFVQTLGTTPTLASSANTLDLYPTPTQY